MNSLPVRVRVSILCGGLIFTDVYVLVADYGVALLTHQNSGRSVYEANTTVLEACIHAPSICERE